VRWLPDSALDRLREAASEPDLSGTPYEILGVLGCGGMGTVYLARDRSLDREVALKVVQFPEGDPGAAERTLREARILARLEHPGIVPVHDAGTLPDGRTWYVMKRVRGSRLDEHASSLSLPDRLRVVQRLCEAVAFAHANGVIHRDLKPENVMVGPFGEVLLMDWGVAKVEDGEARGTVLGTPGYMAPEQERGEIDRIDERTDIYGLGAILGFLLGEEEVPRRLDAIRQRAMAVEPAERYSSVPELAADLGRYLDGLPVAAYRESLAERAGRFIHRHRTPILIVLAYVVMRALLILILGR
jgi:serine/threonine-protein kinase